VTWVLAAVVVVLTGAVAVGAAPVSAPSGPTILVALVNGPKADCLRTRVLRAEAASLKPIADRAVEVAGAYEQPVYSPDRKTVALGGSFGTLILVDAKSVRLKARVRVGPVGDNVRVAAWSTSKRIVAISMSARSPEPYATRVAVIDADRGKVLEERRFLEADALRSDATRSGRVALLVISRRQIAAPRLVVLDERGRIRTVTLARLRAGLDPHGSARTPAFTVDPSGERAFVLGEGQPAAIVDLRGPRVRYKKVAAMRMRRITASHPKGLTPPTDRARHGVWLGDSRIAISGDDSYAWTAFRPPKWQLDSFTPAGLTILDTSTWRARTLDPRPSTFEWLRGRLVAYGRTYPALGGPEPDETVLAFDRSGRLAYKIRGDKDTYWEAFDGRLFLMSPRWRGLQVRDARDGRVLGQVGARRIEILGPC